MTPSKTRRIALDKAEEIARSLSSRPDQFCYDAIAQIKDGGLLYFHCCYMAEFGDYIIIIPEHSELTVQHKDELEYWALYKFVEIPVLEE